MKSSTWHHWVKCQGRLSKLGEGNTWVSLRVHCWDHYCFWFMEIDCQKIFSHSWLCLLMIPKQWIKFGATGSAICWNKGKIDCSSGHSNGQRNSTRTSVRLRWECENTLVFKYHTGVYYVTRNILWNGVNTQLIRKSHQEGHERQTTSCLESELPSGRWTWISMTYVSSKVECVSLAWSPSMMKHRSARKGPTICNKNGARIKRNESWPKLNETN